MQLVDKGSFRTHILIPNDVVGAFTPDAPPQWGWLVPHEVAGGTTYWRNGKPVLRVSRHGDQWLVTALVDLWLQEPSVTVKVAGHGAWWGKRKDGKWEGPFTLRNIEDPYKNTIHFSRARNSNRFCTRVEYREDNKVWRWVCDGGFAKPINKPGGIHIDAWRGCKISSSQHALSGVFTPQYAPLRRWEASGGARLPGHYPPGTTQMHFHGWAGGPGCVVNDKGRTPPPGTPKAAEGGYDKLWHPASWRFLKKGASIGQRIVATNFN